MHSSHDTKQNQMKYHLNAKTNAHIRAEIRASELSNKQLSDLYGIQPNTVTKWRRRADVFDRSHAPKTKRYALTQDEQQAIIAARLDGFKGLDEVIAIVSKKFNKKFSRTTVYYLLKRNGINKKQRPKPTHGVFKKYAPGFIHMDVTEMPVIGQKNKKAFLYVAIDRATRYMRYKLYDQQKQTATLDFMKECLRAFPFPINNVLTDNGLEFSNKLVKPPNFSGVCKDSLLTTFCKQHAIRHRTTKPYCPQTNGLVERANGKIKQATLKSITYKSNQDLRRDLILFLETYNTDKQHGGLLKELKVQTPCQAVKKLCA